VEQHVTEDLSGATLYNQSEHIQSLQNHVKVSTLVTVSRSTFDDLGLGLDVSGLLEITRDALRTDRYRCRKCIFYLSEQRRV